MNSRLSDEEAVRERRRQRIEEAKRIKRRQRMIRRLCRKLAPPVLGVIIVMLLVLAGERIFSGPSDEVKAKTEDQNGVQALEAGDDGASGRQGWEYSGAAGTGEQAPEESLPEGSSTEESSPLEGGQTAGVAGQAAGEPQEPASPQVVYAARATSDTRRLGEDVTSGHAILIDLGSDSILAQKDAESRISPASMTKILTVLVAAEHVENLDDTFTITLDITDYSYVNDCSSAGFAENETVTVRDLFYGTILPSGGDAAAALAEYVAGSREAFVDMMNDKLAELGLSETAHFTNCVGLYDENHYCTAYDMAMILEAAISNDFCKEVLSAHTYTTSKTQQHPEGITISNWFLRRIEDKDSGGEVMCGKTGYVVQSGNCAASYAIDGSGNGYICVTANATSAWRCIYDHVALYKQFL